MTSPTQVALQQKETFPKRVGVTDAIIEKVKVSWIWMQTYAAVEFPISFKEHKTSRLIQSTAFLE